MDHIIQGICHHLDNPMYILENTDGIRYMHNDYGKVLAETLRQQLDAPWQRHSIHKAQRDVLMSKDDANKFVIISDMNRCDMDSLNKAAQQHGVSPVLMERFRQLRDRYIRIGKMIK